MATENPFPPYEVCEDSAGFWEVADENGRVLMRLDSREDAEKVAGEFRALAGDRDHWKAEAKRLETVAANCGGTERCSACLRVFDCSDGRWHEGRWFCEGCDFPPARGVD